MLRLRGHHLLCLHGFRGLGYSPEFVSNMAAIHERLRKFPSTVVEVGASPDDICSACPHISGAGCAKGEGDSELHIAEKDAAVLERLFLYPGDTLSAGTLFKRVASEFDGSLAEFCPHCTWMALGYCSDGLRARTMSIDIEV